MKDKKAQIFTLIALALLALLLMTVSILTISDNRKPIEKRVTTMDTFLFSIEENLDRQLYIAGFRTLFLANDYITKTGQYINVSEFFNESFFNASVKGVHQDIMGGANYSDIISSINDKAKKINVEIIFSNPSINVSQDDPWNIKLTLNVTIKMNDSSGISSWEKEKIVITYIPINSFEDPLYLVNTNSRIIHRFNKTIYNGIYINQGSTTNLLLHTQKGYYTENQNAPNFIKRLQGDLSSDPNGIESLVDLSLLSQQGFPTQQKSVVDYIYFSNNNPPVSQVSGMPSWFYIDDGHKVKYNVTIIP